MSKSKKQIGKTSMTSNNCGETAIQCSKCHSAMDKLEEDYETMSEGEMSDYDAGLWGTYYCPKCKRTHIVEGLTSQGGIIDGEDEDFVPTSTQLKALEKGRRTSWNNKTLRGCIGEMWFANKLRNDGYKVRKTLYYDYDKGNSIINEKGVENLLQNHPKRTDILIMLKSLGVGIPDLICLKNEIISFCEIKTNDSEIRDKQKKAMEVIRSSGHGVYSVRLTVEFNVKETGGSL